MQTEEIAIVEIESYVADLSTSDSPNVTREKMQLFFQYLIQKYFPQKEVESDG